MNTDMDWLFGRNSTASSTATEQLQNMSALSDLFKNTGICFFVAVFYFQLVAYKPGKKNKHKTGRYPQSCFKALFSVFIIEPWAPIVAAALLQCPDEESSHAGLGSRGTPPGKRGAHAGFMWGGPGAAWNHRPSCCQATGTSPRLRRDPYLYTST